MDCEMAAKSAVWMVGHLAAYLAWSWAVKTAESLAFQSAFVMVATMVVWRAVLSVVKPVEWRVAQMVERKAAPWERLQAAALAASTAGCLVVQMASLMVVKSDFCSVWC